MKMNKENNKEKMVSFRIDTQLATELTSQSKKINISTSELIRQSIKTGLALTSKK